MMVGLGGKDLGGSVRSGVTPGAVRSGVIPPPKTPLCTPLPSYLGILVLK